MERFKTAPFSNGFEFPRLTGSFRKLSLSCLFVSSESKREKEALLRSKKVCELTCLLEASWALWRPKCCCCARTAARHCAPVRYRVSLSEPNRRIHRNFHGVCAQTDRLCVIERNCSAPGQVQGDAVCRPANIYTRSTPIPHSERSSPSTRALLKISCRLRKPRRRRSNAPQPGGPADTEGIYDACTGRRQPICRSSDLIELPLICCFCRVRSAAGQVGRRDEDALTARTSEVCGP